MIDFNEYQSKILGFLNPQTVITLEDKLENGLMGLNGEAGEAIDMLKKQKYHSHDLDYIKLAKELGDCLFYIAESASGIGFTLQEIADMNIDKLNKRYITGKFNLEESLAKRDQV